MIYCRIRLAHQEYWYRNVLTAHSDGRYLTLELDAHPSQVHVYLGGPPYASFLLCADGPEVTTALRDEHPDGMWRETNA